MASPHNQFANLNDRQRDFSRQTDDLIAPLSGSRRDAMPEISVGSITHRIRQNSGAHP